MLNDNAKKWVAALRSGEYEQGQGYLSANGKLCCLGVACELYQKSAEAKNKLEASISETLLGVMIYEGNSSCCPRKVMDHLGLLTDLGRFWSTTSTGSKAVDTLARKNDQGSTFAEIADIIESEPEGLFV